MTVPAITVLALVAGFGSGLLFFRSLELNARLWLSGAKPWLPLLLHVGRLAALAGLLLLAVRFGALPLLASFAGLLLARHLVTRPGRGPA